MNAAQRLVQLSGLSSGTAATHLRHLAGAAGVAGALMLAYSGLPAGTALAHLLTNPIPAQAVAEALVTYQRDARVWVLKAVERTWSSVREARSWAPAVQPRYWVQVRDARGWVAMDPTKDLDIARLVRNWSVT